MNFQKKLALLSYFSILTIIQRAGFVVDHRSNLWRRRPNRCGAAADTSRVPTAAIFCVLVGGVYTGCPRQLRACGDREKCDNLPKPEQNEDFLIKNVDNKHALNGVSLNIGNLADLNGRIWNLKNILEKQPQSHKQPLSGSIHYVPTEVPPQCLWPLRNRTTGMCWCRGS